MESLLNDAPRRRLLGRSARKKFMRILVRTDGTPNRGELPGNSLELRRESSFGLNDLWGFLKLLL